MTLRRPINDAETLQSFELAAEERYLDATELIARGHGTAGIYLVGYVAEMLLKNAVFRFEGARPADLVGPRLGPARNWAKRFLPLIDHESYHSLWFWALLLRKKRRHNGRPLPGELDSELVHRTRRLYQSWSVNLRYCGFAVSIADARTALENVTWIKHNHPSLWR